MTPENFKNKILLKIDNNESINERDLSELIYLCEKKRHKGENRRWSRTNISILDVNDRLFKIQWEEGLTEYQENSYLNQPIELFESNKSYATYTYEIIEYVDKDNNNVYESKEEVYE